MESKNDLKPSAKNQYVAAIVSKYLSYIDYSLLLI